MGEVIVPELDFYKFNKIFYFVWLEVKNKVSNKTLILL